MSDTPGSDNYQIKHSKSFGKNTWNNVINQYKKTLRYDNEQWITAYDGSNLGGGGGKNNFGFENNWINLFKQWI